MEERAGENGYEYSKEHQTFHCDPICYTSARIPYSTVSMPIHDTALPIIDMQNANGCFCRSDDYTSSSNCPAVPLKIITCA